MNLTRRQPLFKDVHNLFRFRRTHFSNTYTIQFNRAEIIICQRSMSSETRTQTVDVPVSLEQEVVDSDLSVLTPIVDDGIFEKRLATKCRVEGAVRKKYGNRFTVEFFGSIHYGVSLPKSDLDLVVIDPRLPQGYKRLNGLGAVYNVKTLGRTLAKAGFTNVDPRSTATVPIVKFHDPASGLDCDLNVNDRLGLLNSAMIKEYCDAHPFLRPLLYRIKNWAKPLGLNSPSPVRGSPVSFSSYALALMTISFLQKEGHLPNLQENLPPVTIKPSKQLMWTRKPHKGWDVRFHSAKDWVPPPLPNFDALLSSWFLYWVDFPYETESICIRHGGTTPRTFPPPPPLKKQSKKSKKSKKKKPKEVINASISVNDPFILTKNVTVSVSKEVHESFVKECQNRVATNPVDKELSDTKLILMSQRGST